MSAFLAIVWRLVVISFALFAGCAAASLIILTGLHQLYGEMSGPTSTILDILFGAVVLVFVVFSDAGQLVLAMAAVGIVASEILGLRSWIIHAAAGAICGTLIAVSAETGQSPDTAPSAFANRDMFLFLAAGLGGGLVYWLIAGRKAGVVLIRFSQVGPSDGQAGETSGADGKGPNS